MVHIEDFLVCDKDFWKLGFNEAKDRIHTSQRVSALVCV